MNSQMQVFESETFGAVRVLEIEGDSWWVLKDVCAALGLNTPHKDGFWAKPATLEQFYSKLAQDSPAKTERAPETRPKSVLARIAAARAERAEAPDLQTPKRNTEPER